VGGANDTGPINHEGKSQFYYFNLIFLIRLRSAIAAIAALLSFKNPCEEEKKFAAC
jgi:hypothetical protein